MRSRLGGPVLATIDCDPLASGTLLGDYGWIMLQGVTWLLVLGQAIWIWHLVLHDVDYVMFAKQGTSAAAIPGASAGLAFAAAIAIVGLLVVFASIACGYAIVAVSDVLLTSPWAGVGGMFQQGLLVAYEVFPVHACIITLINVEVTIPVALAVGKWLLVGTIRCITAGLVLGLFVWDVSAQPLEATMTVFPVATNIELAVWQTGPAGWTSLVYRGTQRLFLNGGEDLHVGPACVINGGDLTGGGLTIRVSGDVSAPTVQWWVAPDTGWYFGSGVALGCGVGGLWLLASLAGVFRRITVASG